MSTSVQDFAGLVLLAAGVSPRTITTTIVGNLADLIEGDGLCLAIQQVGALSGSGAALAGKIQESADAITWSDIPGATFPAVTAADALAAITFRRSQRYLRYVGTLGGSTPSAAIAITLGQPRKLV